MKLSDAQIKNLMLALKGLSGQAEVSYSMLILQSIKNDGEVKMDFTKLKDVLVYLIDAIEEITQKQILEEKTKTALTTLSKELKIDDEKLIQVKQKRSLKHVEDTYLYQILNEMGYPASFKIIEMEGKKRGRNASYQTLMFEYKKFSIEFTVLTHLTAPHNVMIIGLHGWDHTNDKKALTAGYSIKRK
jgi:hypothetical protein